MSAEIDDGGPAFPATCNIDGVPLSEHWDAKDVSGMTLRDWFAGQCDSSIYNPSKTFFDHFSRHPSAEELAAYVAHIRLLEADAMIEARKGGEQ